MRHSIAYTAVLSRPTQLVCDLLRLATSRQASRASFLGRERQNRERLNPLKDFFESLGAFCSRGSEFDSEV